MNAEENEIRIADYIDGKLTAVEAQRFMQDIDEDELLRNQYEDELVLRALLQSRKPASETADFFTIPTVKSNKDHGRLALFRYGKIAAMVAGVLLTAGLLMFVVRKRKDNTTSAENTQIVHRNTDTGVTNNTRIDTAGKLAEKVFKDFYKTYEGPDDPVEISIYYEAYKNGQYSKIIRSKRTDYGVMGSEDKNEMLEGYMTLYKGLSLLAQDEPEKAINSFDQLLQSKNSGQPYYPAAAWYKTLSLLKVNDLEKAATLARKLAGSPSNYQKEAARLVTELE